MLSRQKAKKDQKLGAKATLLIAETTLAESQLGVYSPVLCPFIAKRRE